MSEPFAAETRYIKLGPSGRWVANAFANGELQVGYRTIPHDLCLSGDWDAVEKALRDHPDKPGKGTVKAWLRELRDFYTLGKDCLWITFARQQLWWAFAEPDVIWHGGDATEYGARARKTIGPWRNTDLSGNVLTVDSLSTRLTQVAAYRMTICSIHDEDYLLRRIQGIEEPLVARANAVRNEMTETAMEMIARLHWVDFETMVDIIFGRSGWQRVSRVGGSQKDVDLVLENTSLGELAFVQVKSRANQTVVDDYWERFEESGAYKRVFFICHSPDGSLEAGDREYLHIWTRTRLADIVVKSGLYDWLCEKSR
ncbi:MAG: restriction endonuclease [Parvibaculum sp.]|uniref:restriction endonuclease n=1 Tax=Parvibaculum sp. TaxID=2024848 RepID=UPI002847347A|nr:restriction endonuclease [Parvibaculum sp.]MDR3499902.1 restriction endonuclease [Parvibaculum sp.]